MFKYSFKLGSIVNELLIFLMYASRTDKLINNMSTNCFTSTHTRT